MLVLLLVRVLENSRYLAVTLIERNSAGIFGLCFDAESQQIEHDDEHEHDSLTSESGFNANARLLAGRDRSTLLGGGRIRRCLDTRRIARDHDHYPGDRGKVNGPA